MIDNNDYGSYLSFAKNCFNDYDSQSKLSLLTITDNKEANEHFIIITDLILVKHLFVSPEVKKTLGYDASIIDPGFFLTVLHPDDFQRFRVAHNRLLEGAQQMLIDKSNDVITSSEFRLKKKSGQYLSVLFQCYLFMPPSSIETMGMLAVITDLTNYNRKGKRIHHYYGEDRAFFRVPDSDLLNVECLLSSRELEIVHLISEGYTSAQIAEKLFLSSKTVNTHRANVLKKLKATNLMESIKMLKQMGLI